MTSYQSTCPPPILLEDHKKMNLDAHIASLLKLNDKRAISLIYQNYSSILYGIIIRHIPNKQKAEEVLQDVFLKIWNNADQYDKSKGSLFSWMACIARNASVDQLRSLPDKSKVKTPITSISTNGNSEEISDNLNRKLRDNNITENLQRKYRTLLEYVYYKGFSHSEIATELDIPKDAVQARIRNAVMELRNILERKQ